MRRHRDSHECCMMAPYEIAIYSEWRSPARTPAYWHSHLPVFHPFSTPKCLPHRLEGLWVHSTVAVRRNLQFFCEISACQLAGSIDLTGMLHRLFFWLQLDARRLHNANTTMNYRSPHLHHQQSFCIVPTGANIHCFCFTDLNTQPEFHFSFRFSAQLQRLLTTCALGNPLSQPPNTMLQHAICFANRFAFCQPAVSSQFAFGPSSFTPTLPCTH